MLSFQIALARTEGSFRAACEDFSLDEPALRGMRHKLLLEALEVYCELKKKYPRDRRLRQQEAEVRWRLGELYLQLHRDKDRDKEGLAQVEQAAKLYEGLLRESPAARQARFGLAHTHRVLAERQFHKGMLQDGEKEVDLAIDLLEPLTAELRGDEPEVSSFRGLLAWSYNLRATARWSRGEVESGLAYNQKALEIVEPALSANQPWQTVHWGSGGVSPWRGSRSNRFMDERTNLVLLPRVYTNRGMMLNSAGRNTEADWVLQKATTFDRWLVEQDSRLGQFRHALALALLHTGHAQAELGRPARAEAALREARELMRRLCQDEPSVPEYAATRLLAAGYRGESLFRSGQTTAADGFLREAREQDEDLLGGPGKSHLLDRQHARFLSVLGHLKRESGEVARGLEITQLAQEKLKRALEEAPGDPSLRGAWLGNAEESALCRFLKGDITRDSCIAEQRSVLTERKKLAGPRPTRAPRLQDDLAASAALLAKLLLEGGRPAEALACVDEVLPDHERFVREEQERTRKRAAANQPPDDWVPGEPEVPWPVYLRRRPVESEDLDLWRQWSLLLARRGAALAGVGRGEEAARAVRQAVAQTEGLLRGRSPVSVCLNCPPTSALSVWSFFAQELVQQEPCYGYDLTCHLALASTLPGKAGLADPAGQAVQALRDYIASGFDNPYKLRTDPAVDPLRQQTDFEKLVRDLEARVRGKEPT